MSLFRRIKKTPVFFFKKPFLLLLLILLTIITITSIHPTLSFMGWDNFSSYLNLPLSISRSLLGTWRDYRGLGVASDSEVVDLFHQLFMAVFSVILPQTMLDQVYLFGSLWLGLILMYVFGYNLYQYVFPRRKEYHNTFLERFQGHADIFAAIASFFYLCNLSTLSVFYFPMLPYTTRFFAIPAFHLLLFFFVKKKQSSRKFAVFFIILLLFASTSNITATVFVTVLLSLAIHSLSYLSNKKRLLLFFAFFLGLNAFWLLPFANYTIQKSAVIPFATANIEGNEVLLNKPVELFSWQRQLIFYPIFFDITHSDPITNKPLPFHPLAKLYESAPYSKSLFIFPILYIAGSILISLFCTTLVLNHWTVRQKKEMSPTLRSLLILIWIPLHTAVFLFLSLKEYSPLGFIYTFFSNHVPFFSMLFRFGDTKFHPFLAFSASFAASFCLIFIVFVFFPSTFQNLVSLVKKQAKIPRALAFMSKGVGFIVLLVLLAGVGFSFKTYVNGNFVGYFLFNKIPQPYFRIAETINKDKEPVRVLHLPLNKYGYWKAYTWGYFGSSFLNFLLQKPLLDPTFEPASPENMSLNNHISSLQEYIEALPNGNPEQKQTVEAFYHLLQDASVKYLILDETINNNVVSRDEKYWGKTSFAQSKVALDLLQKYSFVKEKKDFLINPYDYSPFPLKNQKQKSDLSAQHIRLYELLAPSPHISFEKNTTAIDPGLTLAPSILFPTDGVFVQTTKQQPFVIFPFERKDAIILDNGQTISYTLPKTYIQKGAYTLQTPTQSTNHVLRVMVWKANDTIFVNLYQVLAPEIQNHTFEDPIGSISLPLTNNVRGKITEAISLSDVRLRIDDTVISIPNDLSKTSTNLGFVLIKSNDFPIAFLQKTQDVSIAPNLFSASNAPDCIKPQRKGYQASVLGTDDSLALTSTNGSVCATASLSGLLPKSTDYAELFLTTIAKSTDLDSVFSKKAQSVTSPLFSVLQSIPKPTMLYLCLQDKNALCANAYRFFNISGAHAITVPIQGPLDTSQNITLTVGLEATTYQKQQATLSTPSLSLFTNAQTYRVHLSPADHVNLPVSLEKADSLTITIPKTLSQESSYNSAGVSDLTFLTTPCEDSKEYRSLRTSSDFLFTFAKKCDNGIFYSKQLGNNLYLWLINYNLLSGQYPVVRIDDGNNEYINERLSMFQGYPTIPIFKTINPQDQNIDKDAFTNLSTLTGYEFLGPSQAFSTGKNITFSLTHYSENDGLIATKAFDIVALPASWRTLSLAPDATTTLYTVPKNYSAKKLLPTLWAVTLPKGTDKGTYVLDFREGFDTQWHLFTKPFASGLQGQEHSRCNGLYNCFSFSLEKPLQENTTLYFFYTPMLLSILGMLATSGTIVLVLLKKLHHKTGN